MTTPEENAAILAEFEEIEKNSAFITWLAVNHPQMLHGPVAGPKPHLDTFKKMAEHNTKIRAMYRDWKGSLMG